MSVVTEPVTITLDGQEFHLKNTLQVRKDFCIKFGGIRPVIQAMTDLNDYVIAQIIGVASGSKKKTDKIFELVVSEGPKSVSNQMSEYVAFLIGEDDEDDEPGNDQAAES